MRRVRSPLPNSRSQNLLLGRLPSAWLSSPSAPSRRAPARLCQPAPTGGHRLPVPRVRCTLPWSAALRRVRRFWKTAWTRWTMPPLRRGGRHQRPSRRAPLYYDCSREVITPTLNQPSTNDIASHGIAGTHLVRHRRNQRTLRAELTVHFQPFQLYEFAVMRTHLLRRPTTTTSHISRSAAVADGAV